MGNNHMPSPLPSSTGPRLSTQYSEPVSVFLVRPQTSYLHPQETCLPSAILLNVNGFGPRPNHPSFSIVTVCSSIRDSRESQRLRRRHVGCLVLWHTVQIRFNFWRK